MADARDRLNAWGKTDRQMYAAAVASFGQHPEVTPGRRVLLDMGLTDEFLDWLMADLDEREMATDDASVKHIPDKRAMLLSRPPKYRCSCGSNHRCDWEGWTSDDDEAQDEEGWMTSERT